jgi:3-oxoacyl-[acyl-carrier protein] reductase
VSRCVLVTGGARGIGDAIIRVFREVGDEVVSLDVIGAEEARDGVRYLEADITDRGAVGAALGEVERIDVVVNNAGIQRLGLTGELAHDDWSRVLEVHLTGAFVCTSAAVGKMPRGGAIVSIASAAAFVGLPGRGAYSAAKAALVGWTRVLAVELAPRGIRANAVAPGFTRSGLVDQALRDGSLEEWWMLERVPLGRLAEPEEIARVVRFLAGDEASYITGHTVVADGGWTAQGIGSAPGWLAAEPREDR